MLWAVKEVSDMLRVSLLRIQFRDLFLVHYGVEGTTLGRHRADDAGIR
jgi:hypothetical protein